MSETTLSETALDNDISAVKSDLGKLRGDFSALKDSFQSFATDRVRSGINTAQETVGEWTYEARTRSRETLRDIADEIEERPLTSIFLAFGLGVILGRLFD